MDARDQRISELEAQVAAKDAVIAAQREEVEQLKQQVAALTAAVAKLGERLGRSSRNSNLPPSSDGPGGRGVGGSSKPGRKRGGQPGHDGHQRELLPVEKVDRVVELFPRECENCWARLPEIRDEKATRYQVTEVPPVKPEVTEYRGNAVTCLCCGYTTSAKVDSVPTSAFGPRLMSLVALLTGVYHLSRRQTVQLLQDLLGVRLSLGAVSAVEARVSEAIAVPVQEAWTKVDAAAVRHADATTWLQAGQPRSLWTLATSMVTVFKILLDGSADMVKPLFESCAGILVSDRATVFSFWEMHRRQICWAHLLRKFVSFAERDGPAGRFGRELLDYAGLVFTYWQDRREGRIDRATYVAWMAPLREQVEACLQRAVAACVPDLSGSCADILAHREALWTFVSREDVEPTNNHAERALRAFVLWRKRSFGAQSDRGQRFCERMMTVGHTARKQRRDVLTFLTECCQALLTGAAAPSLFSAPTPG